MKETEQGKRYLIGEKIEFAVPQEGRDFIRLDIPTVLEKAHKHAFNGGFVASIPHFIRGLSLDCPKVELDDCVIDNTLSPGFYYSIPNKYQYFNYVTHSEEDVGLTPQGNPVVIVSHGGGIFSSPGRIIKSLEEGLTETRAGRITSEEFHNLLNGKCPDDKEIPAYPFREFLEMKNLEPPYAVVIDFSVTQPDHMIDDNIRKRGVYGKHGFGDPAEWLMRDPLFIARVGGIEQSKCAHDKIIPHVRGLFRNTEALSWTTPRVARGRLLFINNQGVYGHLGFSAIHTDAVAVSAEDYSAFRKGCSR